MAAVRSNGAVHPHRQRIGRGNSVRDLKTVHRSDGVLVLRPLLRFRQCGTPRSSTNQNDDSYDDRYEKYSRTHHEQSNSRTIGKYLRTPPSIHVSGDTYTASTPAHSRSEALPTPQNPLLSLLGCPKHGHRSAEQICFHSEMNLSPFELHVVSRSPPFPRSLHSLSHTDHTGSVQPSFRTSFPQTDARLSSIPARMPISLPVLGVAAEPRPAPWPLVPAACYSSSTARFTARRRRG